MIGTRSARFLCCPFDRQNWLVLLPLLCFISPRSPRMQHSGSWGISTYILHDLSLPWYLQRTLFCGSPLCADQTPTYVRQLSRNGKRTYNAWRMHMCWRVGQTRFLTNAERSRPTPPASFCLHRSLSRYTPNSHIVSHGTMPDRFSCEVVSALSEMHQRSGQITQSFAWNAPRHWSIPPFSSVQPRPPPKRSYSN